MSGNKLTVFSASWCKNCEPYKSYLKTLKIDFTEVILDDKDEEKEKANALLASKFGVRSLPTSLVESAEGETLYISAGTGAIDEVRKLMGK